MLRIGSISFLSPRRRAYSLTKARSSEGVQSLVSKGVPNVVLSRQWS